MAQPNGVSLLHLAKMSTEPFGFPKGHSTYLIFYICFFRHVQTVNFKNPNYSQDSQVHKYRPYKPSAIEQGSALSSDWMASIAFSLPMGDEAASGIVCLVSGGSLGASCDT